MDKANSSPKVLPLIKEDGTWIERPDLWVLVRMAYSDGVDERTIEQSYSTLVKFEIDPTEPTRFEDVLQKEINCDLGRRVLAGSTLVNFLKLHANQVPI